MRSRVCLVVLCVVGGSALAYLHWRERKGEPLVCPDSRNYHFLAVNMLLGKGYYGTPIGAVTDYDAETKRHFDVYAAQNKGRPVMGRTPGYPLLLAFIYWLHGVSLESVVKYQIVMTCCVGVLMVLSGALMWGEMGAVAGVAAALLLGTNRDASYPVSELLTESLAGFLMTGAFAAALWAKRGKAWREAIVGVVLSLTVLTRPGLIFVGLLYGAICFIPAGGAWWKRGAAFALSCAVLLGSWAGFASAQAGRRVLLTSAGAGAIMKGMDPVGTARKMGVPVPKIDREDLKRFWRTPAPADFRANIFRGMLRALGRWRQTLEITRIKLSLALERLPKLVWICAVLGFALVAAVQVRTCEPADSVEATRATVVACGLVRSRRGLEMGLILLSLMLGMIGLGYSAPAAQFLFLAVTLVAPFCRLEIQSGAQVGPARTRQWPVWILSWLWGFIFMIVVSHGTPRFVRPFLPVFYLLAVMSVPLFVQTLVTVRGGSLGGRRPVFYLWQSEGESCE